MYKEQCDLDPFQKGFLAHTYPQASGFFHDGKAAFHLMSTWDLTAGPMYSTDKQGLQDAKLGWFFFPEVQGGKGKANDIFGSVYGWLVSKDAPKEAIDFMKVCLRKEIQTKLAAMGLSIPMVKGTAEAIRNPFFKALAVEVDHSDWICVAMDQLLGHDTGRVFNDEAAIVAAGAKSPDDTVKAVEKSWSKNRI
jgi:raffinose/stachyose/melibiose transport system substrate-binding protein